MSAGGLPGTGPGAGQARIRPGAGADADGLTALITAAFRDLPPARWLVPDDGERAAVLGPYFGILVRHGLAAGRVDVLDDGAGALVAAAIWWDGDDHGPADYDREVAAVTGAHLPRFTVFDALMAATHPDRDHHYLGFLATRPGWQSRGLGSALLAHRHAVLDWAGTPAYLEASSTRSRDLYLRHGYRLLGEPFVLPDGPPMWPMWRQPG